MTLRKNAVPVPPPHSQPFHGSIQHPDLWLWDSWTYTHQGEITLFCLALAKTNRAGAPILPGDRNDYPFHVRRFSSSDGCQTWRDCGVFIEPDHEPGSSLSHNVWSGSALNSQDGLLLGLTGIHQPEQTRSFLQTLCYAQTTPGAAITSAQIIPFSDPYEDYERILAAGYYLGPKDQLGASSGEDGGPILAWRDPFFVREQEGVYRAYWAAKVGPMEPAIGQARLMRTQNGLRVDALLPPITPPDSDAYTQSEVPKVYVNPADGSALMLTSTCNRIDESQPDSEVSKELRLYAADHLDGRWAPFSPHSAILPGTEHLFGGEFINVDFANQSAELIAPYTEMASPELQLTFAAKRPVSFAITARDQAPAA